MIGGEDGTTWGSLPFGGEFIFVPPAILTVYLIEETRVIDVEFEGADANYGT